MRFAWLGAVAAGIATASPAPPPAPAWVDPRVVRPLNELEVRDPMEAVHAQHLEKRISADFSLDHQWNNQVLFHGSWSDSDDGLSDSVSLSVKCVECWTKGTVTAKLTTEDIFEPVIRLSFEGVEAYVDVDVSTSASATWAINLFTTESPLGLSLPGLDVGLNFYVDLIFSLSANLDLEGGFYVKLEDDAFLETDVLTGDITDHFFDGIGTKSIPITVHSGSATFKADLRLRVQCGVESELDLLGIGAGAVVGIYANILEFVAVLDSIPSCHLQSREWFDLNVGAYARISVAVDHSTIGYVPTVSTTFFSSPTFTQCWLGDSPVESGTGSLRVTTTVPTASTVSTLSASTGVSIERTMPLPTTRTPSASTVLVSTIPGTGATPSVTSHHRPTHVPTPGLNLPHRNSSTTTGNTPLTTSTSSASSTPLRGSTLTPSVDAPSLVTSTVYATTEYTITSCAASVVNCPSLWEKQIVVTRTIDSYATVCPAGASITFPVTTATPDGGSAAATVHIITELVVLSKIEPVVETFVAPTTRPPAQHTITAFIPTPTTVLPPMVKDDNLAVTHVAHNNTSAAAATSAVVGTGSVTSSTLVPTVPASAAIQRYRALPSVSFVALLLCPVLVALVELA